MKNPPRKPSPSHRSEPDEYAEMIGKRIKALRLERGINFDAFVELTGLGRGYVSELERGLVVCSIRTLETVADVLELAVADLVLEGSPREQLFGITLTLADRDVKKLLQQATAMAAKND